MDRSRPSSHGRGVSASIALKRWSDPDSYSELVLLSGMSDTDDLPSHERSSEFIRDAATRKKYDSQREALEEAFRLMLLEALVVCSAIRDGGDRREVVEPNLWDELEIAYDLDGNAYGNGRCFRSLEFFEPWDIPRSVEVPEWLEKLAERAIEAEPQDSDRDAGDLILFAELNASYVIGASDELSEADAELFRCLLTYRRSEVAANLDLHDYAFIPTGQLTQTLGENEVSFRQRVGRFRQKVGAEVIESEKWRGYRLSTALIEVPHAVIRSRTLARKSRIKS